MGLRFDEKGKFFTDVVAKDAILARIRTVTHLIRGWVYVRRGDRLRDELNRAEQFLAVTDVTIYGDQGEILYSGDFLAVNRDQIVWLLPEEETPPPAETGGQP